jgi:hypothetical protein
VYVCVSVCRQLPRGGASTMIHVDDRVTRQLTVCVCVSCPLYN